MSLCKRRVLLTPNILTVSRSIVHNSETIFASHFVDTYRCIMDSANIEQVILSALAEKGEIENTWDFAISTGIEHQIIVGAVKSLLVDKYVAEQALSSSYWELTEEGKRVVSGGSQEFIVFSAIAAAENSSIAVADLNKQLGDVAKIGLGGCMKNKWVKKVGDNLVKNMDSVVDQVVNQLQDLSINHSGTQFSDNDLKGLKRRQLIEQKVRKSLKVTKGEDFSSKRVRKMPTLTKDMLVQKGEVRTL